MSDIPDSAQRVQLEGARTRAPTSESLIQTIGGSINYLLTQVAALLASSANIVTADINYSTSGGSLTTVVTLPPITKKAGTLIRIYAVSTLNKGPSDSNTSIPIGSFCGILLGPTINAGASYLAVFDQGNNEISGIAGFNLGSNVNDTVNPIFVPSGGFMCLDFNNQAAAGTFTYTIKSFNTQVSRLTFVAEEIK